MDDVEMNGLPDSPSLELGEIREDELTNLDASTSAYTADDERSSIPRPFQQPQEPRGRQQRRRQNRTRNRSSSRHRYRCRCGCEACFCDEPWPAEDPDRTPRASEHMDLRPDFTSSGEITPENFTNRVYGLGLDDFMDVVEIDDNCRWATPRRQYRFPERCRQTFIPRYPWTAWNMNYPDWSEYYTYGRFGNPFTSTHQDQEDFPAAEYYPVFHVHNHRHLYPDNRWRRRNQKRGTVPSGSRAMMSSARMMRDVAWLMSCFLNLLNLFATLIILYGAVRPYFFDLRVNDTVAPP